MIDTLYDIAYRGTKLFLVTLALISFCVGVAILLGKLGKLITFILEH